MRLAGLIFCPHCHEGTVYEQVLVHSGGDWDVDIAEFPCTYCNTNYKSLNIQLTGIE